MCSFVYGYALSPPILGKYFELPQKTPSRPKLLFEEDFRVITDVCILLTLVSILVEQIVFTLSSFANSGINNEETTQYFLGFQIFAYRYIDTEKYVVRDIQQYRSCDELLESIKEADTSCQHL